MAQTKIDALIARAKAAGVTMSKVCGEAGIAESTVSRARSGADMKLGTFERLDDVVSRYESAVSPASR